MARDAHDVEKASRGEGIRERKKRQTRELISNTATRMFLARGFDAVKVSDIARECDVAEKTVYQLLPDEGIAAPRPGGADRRVDQAGFGPAATRAPIDAALDVLAAQLDGILAALPPGRRGSARCAGSSTCSTSTASLRAAQRDMDARLVKAAADAMAQRAGLGPEEPEVQIAAEMILGLWRIQFAALRRYTAGGMSVGDGLGRGSRPTSRGRPG